IVRGTQLRDTIQQFYDYGALEVHMRPACPPLVYSCEFLNFSRSKTVLDLAARRAIRELEGDGDEELRAYTDASTSQYATMVDRIRQRLSLTTLKYQKLDDLVNAIGLPKTKLCTYCWDGCQGCQQGGEK
ncbi:MAG TPA: amidophosphoribosyltransferase, partial [Candidatus Hydrogenedentes bacterium]|nr:amidophosphoribosyltransferase [Candidatus Hydrogenedentota bacterium]